MSIEKAAAATSGIASDAIGPARPSAGSFRTQRDSQLRALAGLFRPAADRDELADRIVGPIFEPIAHDFSAAAPFECWREVPSR